eukprot:2179294-Rhodomonas_salina.1
MRIWQIGGFLIAVYKTTTGGYIAYPCQKVRDGEYQAVREFAKAVSQDTLDEVKHCFPEYNTEVLGPLQSTYKDKGVVRIFSYDDDDYKYTLFKNRQMTTEIYDYGGNWRTYFKDIEGTFYEPIRVGGFMVALKKTNQAIK